MPRDGFKSITINSELYEKFLDYYGKARRINDRSLSAFLIRRMDEIQTEKQNLNRLASKIEKVPEKFTERKIKVNKN